LVVTFARCTFTFYVYGRWLPFQTRYPDLRVCYVVTVCYLRLPFTDVRYVYVYRALDAVRSLVRSLYRFVTLALRFPLPTFYVYVMPARFQRLRYVTFTDVRRLWSFVYPGFVTLVWFHVTVVGVGNLPLALVRYFVVVVLRLFPSGSRLVTVCTRC